MNRRVIVALATTVALVAASCSGSPGSSTPTTGPPATSVPPSEGPPATGNAFPASLVDFGLLKPVPLMGDAPAYAGPSTPHSLDKVRIPSYIRSDVTQSAVEQTLTRSGFAIVPGDTKLMFQTYTAAPNVDWPVFVTTDAAYHQWHLTFDKVLRSIEQDVLLPKLETLAGGMLRNAREQAAELKGTPLSDPADRVLQLMQVESALLDLPTGTLGRPAEQELALIKAHAGQEVSPILGGQPIDYSLYTPRGHYTRTAELTRYFLGMSLLGQSAFSVTTPDVGPLRLAVLAARLILPDGLGNARLVGLWRDLYEPTAFMVGLADDYTPFELADAVTTVDPRGIDQPARLSDPALADVRSALLESRPVRIDPETASVRLMGTRFVIDSFIFDQLVYPNVGTPDQPRLFPSPLDLATTFGSDFASGIQKQGGQSKYLHYDEQIQKMTGLVAARTQADWGASVYDAWLWALQPSWVAHGKAFPDFMRTKAWAAKAHQSAFGSFTELRHDTILYVKQSTAEGESPPPDLTYRNWVEPDPVVYERLSAMASLMRHGLAQRKLLTPEQTALLSDTQELFDFFARIARDELAGKPISGDDNHRLLYIGDELEALWWRTSDAPGGNVPSADDDDAVVADIARGGNDVLEVGTGRFDRIYVLVPDMQGRFEVAVGATFSYYEFQQPVSNRLADEQWRAMLDTGKAPPGPTGSRGSWPAEGSRRARRRGWLSRSPARTRTRGSRTGRGERTSRRRAGDRRMTARGGVSACRRSSNTSRACGCLSRSSHTGRPIARPRKPGRSGSTPARC
ncbi:MAG: DUF3160 domain-containing protein [Actinobacteria bacterium]|nr:DUF3160 domain-containing protein [Actinomycetota bacterium]